MTDTQASSASAAAERAEPNVAGVSGLEFEVQAMTMDLSLLSGTTRLSNGRKVTVR